MAILNQPIAELISRIIVVLIAMDVHEFAHAYIANRMGDTTARDMGKMSLNPLVNINWFGFAMFVFIGFGILGSAPVNPARMRTRWGLFWAVLAGPLSNLLLAAICSIPFWLGLVHYDFALPRQAVPTLDLLLTDAVQFNVLLFLFNLIPVFPLDGWTIVGEVLPREARAFWYRNRVTSSYLFFGLIFLSFVGINILGAVINPPTDFLIRYFIFKGQ